MRINPYMNYSGMFNSLPKSNNATQGLASLASEYKNISRGSYRTLANAYVKKLKAEETESSKKPASDSKEEVTEPTKLDPKKMTSSERLQAARDAADKAASEKFKQTYGGNGGYSGATGYSSLFNIKA